MADSELERFQRDISLRQYAEKAGFEPRPREEAPGLTILEHPNRDAIVVARDGRGRWIYAGIADCAPRAPGETGAHALERLRVCIARTSDKGTIVEFVQRRDWTAPTSEVTLERVRERLREFRDEGVPLDAYGALSPPRSIAPRARDAATSMEVAAGPNVPTPLAERSREQSGDRTATDGMPVRLGTVLAGVEERLRRWQEAERNLEQTRGRGPTRFSRERPGREPERGR